jgi:hypothetical protein
VFRGYRILIKDRGVRRKESRTNFMDVSLGECLIHYWTAVELTERLDL